jgi:hypothetical protein
MPGRGQHVPVVRPDFGKPRHPGGNQMNRVASPDKNRVSQRPQGLMHFPEQRFGDRSQLPGPQFDVGTKGRCKRSRLWACQLPFPVTGR